MELILRWRGPPRRLNLSSPAWRSLARVYPDQMARVSWRVRAAYGLTSRYLSRLEALQDRLQRAALAAPLPRRPLFVIGHWRSGTTFLHELLACDARFQCTSTYACMNPQHFLLSERGSLELGGVRETHRPMDRMRVSSLSPQEDEFALLCLGARSPYEGVFFPDALPRALASACFGTLAPAEQRDWQATARRFLALAAARAPERTLLLKSPPHAGRIGALLQLFPDARFVHIVRDPFDVAASTRRMWQDLFALYALTPPPWPDVLPQVADGMAALAREVAVQRSGGASWHELRYEDLARDPLGALQRLYAALALGDFTPARAAVADWLAQRADHRPSEHRLSDAERALVAARCAAPASLPGADGHAA